MTGHALALVVAVGKSGAGNVVCTEDRNGRLQCRLERKYIIHSTIFYNLTSVMITDRKWTNVYKNP